MFIAHTLREQMKRVFALSDGGFSVFACEHPEFGDYSTNVAFVWAKDKHTSPFLLAEDIKKELDADVQWKRYVQETRIQNGFMNFVLNPSWIVQLANEKAERKISSGDKKTIVVEYSSPNIGKTLAIAHIRSTVIGDALARIFTYLGWRVITDSHVGDWGMLAGKLIAAYKKYSHEPFENLSIKQWQDLYVQFTTWEKEQPDLTEFAKQETVKLQHEDKQSMAIWRALVKTSIDEFTQTYAILGTLPFGHQYGESHYRKTADAIVRDFEAKGFAKQSEGALIVPLDAEKLPPMLIRKSDDAFLYATSDLATILFRKKTWKPDTVLYVVANEQALHFEQIFAVNAKYRLDPDAQLVHVKFGMMLGLDGKKFSTRKGSFISLRDVISEACERAYAIARKKTPDASEQDARAIAEVIGIGAIKYNDLSQNRNTDILFDWNRMLSLEGNSAPYIQYTYARLASVLRKTHASGARIAWSVPLVSALEPDEVLLLKKTIGFHDAVRQAAQEYLPNIVANYVYETATMANAWYEKHSVMSASGVLQKARIALVWRAMDAIRTGLGLLGVRVLEKM